MNSVLTLGSGNLLILPFLLVLLNILLPFFLVLFLQAEIELNSQVESRRCEHSGLKQLFHIDTKIIPLTEGNYYAVKPPIILVLLSNL